MKKLLLPSLLILALAACESDPVVDNTAMTDPGGSTASTGGVATVNVNPSNNATGLPPWALDSAGNSVYFDYDSYVIRSEARSLIDAHAKLLAQQPNRKATIQGTADERGSREYNLALGQKRAEAVRRALRLLGARDAQIEAVSLGEEHPACTEATESCYARNRRGDFVYLGR
ncbi:MAG: peptidoglycan-associated lipoprotein Pal [Azoarcus sp.]|jgi:peptidoglycan-associated lipoprotein|nr:peptidoglycan-associated lipoprotein Pal [Azoarcus sp.]